MPARKWYHKSIRIPYHTTDMASSSVDDQFLQDHPDYEDGELARTVYSPGEHPRAVVVDSKEYKPWLAIYKGEHGWHHDQARAGAPVFRHPYPTMIAYAVHGMEDLPLGTSVAVSVHPFLHGEQETHPLCDEVREDCEDCEDADTCGDDVIREAYGPNGTGSISAARAARAAM